VIGRISGGATPTTRSGQRDGIWLASVARWVPAVVTRVGRDLVGHAIDAGVDVAWGRCSGVAWTDDQPDRPADPGAALPPCQVEQLPLPALPSIPPRRAQLLIGVAAVAIGRVTRIKFGDAMGWGTGDAPGHRTPSAAAPDPRTSPWQLFLVATGQTAAVRMVIRTLTTSDVVRKVRQLSTRKRAVDLRDDGLR